MPVDTKEGWCSNCRSGSCALCVSVRCTHEGAAHTMRPRVPTGQVRTPGVSQLPARPAKKAPARLNAPRDAVGARPVAKAKKRQPRWELVAEEPPEHEAAARLSVEEQARLLVEELFVKESHVWHRLTTYWTPGGAAIPVGKLRKRFGPEFLWKTGRFGPGEDPRYPEEQGTSAIYVRWLGARQVGEGEEEPPDDDEAMA